MFENVQNAIAVYTSDELVSDEETGEDGNVLLKDSDSHPHSLNGKPEAIVLFNNLDSIPATHFQCPADADQRAELALALDRAMREHAPAGWKGDDDDPRAKQVLNTLYPIMACDRTATQAIFDIIKQQPGY